MQTAATTSIPDHITIPQFDDPRLARVCESFLSAIREADHHHQDAATLQAQMVTLQAENQRLTALLAERDRTIAAIRKALSVPNEPETKPFDETVREKISPPVSASASLNHFSERSAPPNPETVAKLANAIVAHIRKKPDFGFSVGQLVAEMNINGGRNREQAISLVQASCDHAYSHGRLEKDHTKSGSSMYSVSTNMIVAERAEARERAADNAERRTIIALGKRAKAKTAQKAAHGERLDDVLSVLTKGKRMSPLDISKALDCNTPREKTSVRNACRFATEQGHIKRISRGLYTR